MADLPDNSSIDALRDPVDATYWPDDPNVSSAERPPTWSVYDGRPEAVSDGVEPTPAPSSRPPRRWPWAVAGVVTAAGASAAAIIIVAAIVVVTPNGQRGESHQAPVVAPAQWQRVDPSLTAGLVIVDGAAEADGIVLNSSGLVTTSYARIMGDSRPRDGFQLRVAADGQDAVTATIVRSDAATDIAIVEAGGFVPPSVARLGTPARVGDRLTLLDDQGGSQPVVGIGVTVTATGHVCSRAGSTAHPKGFQFTLDVASAEPGAALVRADGMVVGMYYGGDDATHHCAIPIADVAGAARLNNR